MKKKEPKNIFVSVFSHEVRTPLTSIYGYAQLLSKSTDNFSPAQKRWVASLYFETARMASLVEEMLQLYQLQENIFKVFKQKTLLATIIQSATKKFKALYPEYTLKVDNKLGKIAGVINGDEAKLSQAFTSLLASAAKMAETTNKIAMTLGMSKDYYNVEINYSGQVITILDSKAPLAKISKEVSLYMACAIILAHQGEIKVKSGKNKEVIIGVQLPKS